mgnify:CR=1 FL=1
MKKLPVFISFLAAFVVSGCSGTADNSVKPSENNVFSRDIFAMDTYMSLKAYGSNADYALGLASERIIQLEETLSVTNEESDIYILDHADGAPTELGSDTIMLIEKAIKTGSKTNGCLDITLYPIVREWGFTTGDYKIPSDDTIAEMLENVDYKRINVSDDMVTLPPDCEIDLGALAKGYASDEIMRILSENGVTSAIVSLGGNVQALGSKPDGSDWRVAVRDPFAPDTDMCIVEISDKAVITSGNYERFFVGNDGNTYWHIIDPADGYPADNGLVSVTIIGGCGLDCDAYSTAMFVAGTEKAIEFYKSVHEFEMILVTDDAKIYYSEGLEGSFTNISSMPAEVIALD